MSEWIAIPADALIESKRKRATETQFFRSPFDVPTAIRISSDPTLHTVTLELRYIGDDERTVSFTGNDRVHFDVGRYSRRIFRMRVKAEGLEEPNELFTVLDNAVERLRATSELSSVENYDATGEAITKKQPQILQQLSLASAW